MKKLIAFLSMGLLFYPIKAKALELICPKEVSTEQKLLNIPDPWQGRKTPLSPILSGVSIYNGPPVENAQLAPRNKDSNAPYAVWTFDKDNKRDYWLECHYDHTQMTLSRPLPRGLSSCKVFFYDHIHVAGNRAVKQILCN